MPGYTTVTSDQINTLIQDLITFLGGEVIVRQKLDDYSRRRAQSTPFLQLYVDKVHPWWKPLFPVFDLVIQGKSIAHLMSDIRPLLGDCKMIADLSTTMSPAVRIRYVGDLLSDNASDALAELEVAWRYQRDGFQIEWAQSNGGNIPEFYATKGTVRIAVECKNISPDNARKIKRKDFHRLSDDLLPVLKRKKLHGELEITIKDSLPTSNQAFSLLATALETVAGNSLAGTFQSGEFTVKYDLKANNDVPILNEELAKRFRAQHLNEHVAVLFGENGVNPTTMRARSATPERVAEGISRRLKEARDQIGTDLGLIVGFIPEVENFVQLRDAVGMKAIVQSVCNSPKANSIGGVLFSTDLQVVVVDDAAQTLRPTLFFMNPMCTIAPSGFPFIAGVREEKESE